MAGLTAAGLLRERGWSVVLLDKGRGVGGRMATRRMGASRFDHGAQFFTVRDGRFAEATRRWEEAGWISPWFTQEGHVRYRATSGMAALAKRLAQGLDVRKETKAVSVEIGGAGWRVSTDSGEVFQADALLLTAPAPQCSQLLCGCADSIPDDVSAALAAVEYEPCFALLVTLENTASVPSPGYVRPGNGPVEWIADNTQKGVSEGSPALTIHASAAFSREHFEADQEHVARVLLAAANPFLGGKVTDWQLHRWKYSRPVPGDRPLKLFSTAPAPLAIRGRRVRRTPGGRRFSIRACGSGDDREFRLY